MTTNKSNLLSYIIRLVVVSTLAYYNTDSSHLFLLGYITAVMAGTLMVSSYCAIIHVQTLTAEKEEDGVLEKKEIVNPIKGIEQTKEIYDWIGWALMIIAVTTMPIVTKNFQFITQVTVYLFFLTAAADILNKRYLRYIYNKVMPSSEPAVPSNSK